MIGQICVPTAPGRHPILVYAHEVDDPSAAHAAYAVSTLPIDLEHRREMTAALGAAVDPELLYDVRL